MSRTTRAAKRTKTTAHSAAVRTAAPIRSNQAQDRFAKTATKLGASSRVIKAAQKG